MVPESDDFGTPTGLFLQAVRYLSCPHQGVNFMKCGNMGSVPQRSTANEQFRDEIGKQSMTVKKQKTKKDGLWRTRDTGRKTAKFRHRKNIRVEEMIKLVNRRKGRSLFDIVNMTRVAVAGHERKLR